MGAYRRGFNEAGARTPRKVAQDRTGHMCSPGFNEAGARTPRKVGDPTSDTFLLWASMRPGRERPGKHGRLEHGSQVVTLQ